MTPFIPSLRPAALIVGLALAAAPFLDTRAHASSEREFRDWVYAINTSGNWRIRFSSLNAGGRDGLHVADVVLTSVPAGFKVAVPNLRLGGPVTADGGRLNVGMLRAARATVAGPDFRIALADVDAEDVTIPDLRGFGWDDDKPMTSLARSYTLLAGAGVAAGSVDRLRITQLSEGVASAVSYDAMAVDGWADGRIARVRTGAMRMESPSPDGIVRMSSNGLASRGIDIGAIAHAFDPDAYGHGRGDGVWHTAVESAVYNGFAFDVPDAVMTVGRVAIENVRVRQAPRSFVAFVDRALHDEALFDSERAVMGRAFDVLSSVSIGDFTVEDIDVDAAGVEDFELARFALRDASMERLGTFALEGFKAGVEGEGYVDIGRFHLGDIRFPSRDAVLATEQFGGHAPDTDALPLLGNLEIADFEVRTVDLPRTRLGRFRLEFDDYVDGLPASVVLEIARARFATSLIEQRRARELMDALGYDEIDADIGFRARWNPDAGTVTVDRLLFAMRDMGTLEGEARFRGLDRERMGDPDAFADALDDLEFAGGTLTFTDDSAVARGLAMQAREMQVETEVFREQIASALPFMLSFVGEPEFQQKIVPVLQTFIRTPGEVTLTAAPREPVAISAIEKLITSAPQTIPDLLSVTLTGIAGEAPVIAGDEPSPPDPADNNAGGDKLRPTLDPDAEPAGEPDDRLDSDLKDETAAAPEAEDRPEPEAEDEDGSGAEAEDGPEPTRPED